MENNLNGKRPDELDKALNDVEQREEREGTAARGGRDKERRTPKGVYSHKFEPVYKYDGKEYVTLDFRFCDLIGDDFIRAEYQMTDDSTFALDVSVSKTYQSKLAAMAAKIGEDVILNMPIRDFNKITNEVRNFLTL